MATAFSDFYDLIRVATGDTHATVQRYTDTQLANALRLALLDMPETFDEASAGSGTITPDPATKVERATIILSAALELVAPRAAQASVRAPGLSWSRKEGPLAARLERQLRTVRNYADGGISIDTTLIQFLESGDRTTEGAARTSA